MRQLQKSEFEKAVILMKKICLIIEIHQPMRLETYRFFEIMRNHYYYNDYENEYNIKHLSEKYYLPANRILLDLIHHYKSSFKISFCFSGVVLDQFELYAPEVLDSYKELVDTGCVELLSGTYSNSLGPLTCKKNYYNQVKLQKARIKSIFGRKPLTFQGRDLYNYNCSLTYPGIILLSGNGKLNKYISYRVSGKNQSDWSLSQEKLVRLLNTCWKKSNDSVKLFIPYNTFGSLQNNVTRILEFLDSFPVEVLSNSDYTFVTPAGIEEDSKFCLQMGSSPEISSKHFELFYASFNELQSNAFEKLYSFSERIEKCDDPFIKKDWLYLQSSDHFYFMNPVLYEESELHSNFLPFDSHYFAYINYMNILMDFSDRLEKWFSDYLKDQNGCTGKIAKVKKGIRGPISLEKTQYFAGNQVNNMGKSDLKIGF